MFCSTDGLRLVEWKYGEFISGEGLSALGLDVKSVGRVGAENEITALLEMVGSRLQIIEDLSPELEEERNASSSTAYETMSMILRMQREKAEIQMEATQFRRFTDEKMGRDRQEMTVLEILLFKREQTIQSLVCEVRPYKQRLMSFGLTEAETDGERIRGPSSNARFVENHGSEYSLYNYPPLKCNLNETDGALDGTTDNAAVDKYTSGETPREEMKDLEHGIMQMERSSSLNQVDGEKNDLLLGDGITQGCLKMTVPVRLSAWGGTIIQDQIPVSRKPGISPQVDDHSSLKQTNNASEPGDDTSDQVCTISSVDNGAKELKPAVWNLEGYVSNPRESMYWDEDTVRKTAGI